MCDGGHGLVCQVGFALCPAKVCAGKGGAVGLACSSPNGVSVVRSRQSQTKQWEGMMPVISGMSLSGFQENVSGAQRR